MATKAAMPGKLYIGHLVYEVLEDDATVDRLSVKLRSDLDGVSHNGKQLIAIRPGLGGDYKREVLLHEVLHQCLRVSGADPDKDAKAGCEDVEERTVVAMAGPLLETLRANPQLYTYLRGA